MKSELASGARRHAECLAEEFGHDGLELDDDFEAIYFPGHTHGHSVFRWRHGGKRFLFTGHVMRLEDNRWNLNYNPTKAPEATGFDHLAEADLLPTHAGKRTITRWMTDPGSYSSTQWQRRGRIPDP